MKKICKNCESDDLIYNLLITDNAAHHKATLSIEIQRNPKAMLNKDVRKHPLKAHMCCNCGNVEFSISNPQQLKSDYLKNIEK
jgi:hypothetical protein